METFPPADRLSHALLAKPSHNLSKLLRHHCTMFQNFLSVKRKRKKKKSASLLFAPQLAMGSRRPRVVSQTILNKQAPLGEMENGTFRTSVKFQWVGAAECVCERFAGHWRFVRGGHETRIYQNWRTVPLWAANNQGVFPDCPCPPDKHTLHHSLHFPKCILFTF